MSTDTPWIKATASGGDGGGCVEMRAHSGAVELRDTKDHGHGPSLRVTASEFASLITAAKNGEFDQLLG